ncbi:ABC transporter permease [Pseudomonas capsici]|uniref:ABC transporter permease n=1 Tax=Pseudomonas capsici TaxID=2810614 RepID=A0ABT3BRP3_9PSED|nr:ABC transporter permease [Pseudomonas capsici]RMO13394.1 ABC transporter, permease protein [Pseudomonas cichorii]MBN6717207.1 ABC transporter permease [Pseudomonas capsici]MBN6722264.1 ABC transporter permease [Pseudomonas capsici]MBN6727162.1 ABC transporter permease [Pseudomonas capsici]MCV4266336.1 ABC transporter permease [Pseudomonas capsici]
MSLSAAFAIASGQRWWRRSPALTLGGSLILLLLLVAIFAPLLSGFDPNQQNIEQRLLPPSASHWLGTDGFGRDLFTRLLYGTRPTLLLVSLVLLLTLPIGVLVGVAAGFYGGWPERILMRMTDVFMAFPQLVLALAFVAILGPGLLNGALALSLTAWPAYARQARAETSVLRDSDYLAAAHLQGIRGARLLLGHVLPLCLPSVIVRVALNLGGIILAAAGLGFLGLGVEPPTAEWGSMVADGSRVIFDQWWVAAAPGIAILLTSLSFNLLGDGLRDVLDPRHGS